MSAAHTIDIDAIKAATDLQRIVAETLPLYKHGPRVRVGLCPFHSEKTPSFTVWRDHFHCFGCNARGDAIDWLERARRMTFREAVAYLGGGGSGTVVQGERPKRPADDDAVKRNAELAARIWAECSTAACSIVEDYLRSRGLRLPETAYRFLGGDCGPHGTVLRYHPRCPRGKERLPAMVALMTDPVTGEPRGVHRTFLRPDGGGKADIDKPKLMLGPAGVIRLAGRVTNGLGIAEGIETALAVAQRLGWGPVWAVGSAGGIAGFPLLPATTLNIFVDHDEAGIRAGEDCAQRWAAADLKVHIHLPPPGTDWADAAGKIAP